MAHHRHRNHHRRHRQPADGLPYLPPCRRQRNRIRDDNLRDYHPEARIAFTV